MRKVTACLFALLLQSCAQTTPVPQSSPAASTQPVDSGRPEANVIIKPSAAVSQPGSESYRRQLSAASDCELVLVRQMAGRLYLFRVSSHPGGSVAACVDRLNRQSSVEYAELDSIQKAH